MTPNHLIFDNFSSIAQEMRKDIEQFYADPYKQGEAHEVWNYWYVPNNYTYLRTKPEKIIRKELIDSFMVQLKTLALEELGMEFVFHPFLSMYIHGFGQAFHNDSKNGNFAYVFSLTDWANKRFDGGETLLFKEQDYWGEGLFKNAGVDSSFYHIIPSLFNRLLVFDDRLIHGVRTLQGSLNPKDARFVLHGHILTKKATIVGGLQNNPAMQKIFMEVFKKLSNMIAQAKKMDGFATFSLIVNPEGQVQDVKNLVNRIICPLSKDTSIEFVNKVKEVLSETKMPTANGITKITLPVLVG